MKRYEEFSEFAEGQADRLLSYAFALTGAPHDAWDLFQESIVRVGERWDRLDGDPAAYARVIMVRLNIDRVRRLKRELLTGPVPESENHSVEVVDVVDAWLVVALASLSPRQRTALALRYVEDLDLAGVAQRMGCSIGTAKSHLSRGTERLRAHPSTKAARPTYGRKR